MSGNRHFFAFLTTVFWMAILSGCSSYRAVGRYQSRSTVYQEASQKYRIRHLSFSVRKGINTMLREMNETFPYISPDPWSLPQHASLLDEEKLKTAIQTAKPAVFITDKSATPVDIKFICQQEFSDLGWTILCPYLVTLGVFPAWTRRVSFCEMIVTVDEQRQSKIQLEFTTDGKMSVLSPLGLVHFDETPNAIAQKIGNGIFTAPHENILTAKQFTDTVSQTIAIATSAALAELEKSKAESR